MATKTIIRYTPENPLVGRRELSPADFKSLGIFTQKTMLRFDKERNWWLDAEDAKVSKEALRWFEASPEFTVESQEVDNEDPEVLRQQEAYDASLGRSPQPRAAGEIRSETSTTMQSTKAKA